VNEKKSKITHKDSARLNQTPLSIHLDKIIEKEMDRLANNERLNEKHSDEIILLRRQWNDFCRTYKKLTRAGANYEENILGRANKKLSPPEYGK
jgi:hypothetical protein